MVIRNQLLMEDGLTLVVLESKNKGEPWYCKVKNHKAEADKQSEELYYFNAIVTEKAKGVRPGHYVFHVTPAWFQTLKAFMDNANGKLFLFHAERNGRRGATTPSTTGELSSQDLAKVAMWKVHSQSIVDIQTELLSRQSEQVVEKSVKQEQPAKKAAFKEGNAIPATGKSDWSPATVSEVCRKWRDEYKEMSSGESQKYKSADELAEAIRTKQVGYGVAGELTAALDELISEIQWDPIEGESALP